MKLAIIGSRGITSLDLTPYMRHCTEVVSGGARGVDSIAAKYARDHGLKLTEFLPEYERYGKAAPIIRNKKIVDYSDMVIVFWNGTSKGTLSVIKYAEKQKKPLKIFTLAEGHNDNIFK